MHDTPLPHKKNKGREKKRFDGEINTTIKLDKTQEVSGKCKSIKSWEINDGMKGAGAVAINLHQSTGKEEIYESLTMASIAGRPSLSSG